MPKNKRSKNKNTTSLLIILIIIAILLLIFVFIWQAQKSISDSNANTNISEENSNKNESTSESWSVYTESKTSCSFSYPSNWSIEDEYYYKTPGGTEATVPTIILWNKKIGPEATAVNQIRVNMRQAFCMASDPLVIQEETVGDVIIDHYTYYQSDKETVSSWCMEAEVDCLDVNGKVVAYSIMSYFDEEEVGDIFKEVVKSFEFVK